MMRAYLTVNELIGIGALIVLLAGLALACDGDGIT